MQSFEKTSQGKAKQTPRKAKYDFISYEIRKQLIRLVFEDQVSIYRASRMTGINNATAKVIIRKYRDDGTMFIRKSERNNIRQEQSDCSQKQCSMHRPEKSEEEEAPILLPQNNFEPFFPPSCMFQTAPYYIYPPYYLYSPAFQ